MTAEMNRNRRGKARYRVGARAVLALAAVIGLRIETASAQLAAPQVSLERSDADTLLRMPGGELVRRTSAQVSNARLIEIDKSLARIVTWDETIAGDTQPYYAISLDGASVDAVTATSYALKLRHGEFDPALAPVRMAPAGGAGNLHIVQFVAQPLEVFRRQIAALGGTVRHYLAHHAYIVEMNPDVQAQVALLPYVRAITPYLAEYRLEEPLRLGLAGQAPPLGVQRYRLEVFDATGAQKIALAAAIDELGGTVHDRDPHGIILEATLSAEQLSAVAQRDEVVFIDRWGPPVAAMNNVRAVGGATSLQSIAGYTGTGVRGEIMDAGCQTSHPAFAGRLVVRLPGPDDSHGTATFGITFGDGTGNANGRGILHTGVGIFSWWAPPNRYTDAAALVSSPYNCVFQSNSWGTGPFARNYTTASSELDRIVFDYDIVILQGQGNYDNQDSLREAWGKNIVSVGGIYHFNEQNLANDAWNGPGSNASIGPAEDGRIKPDLSFWYDSILTTTSGSNYTSGFGGTSAATPETAGHFGLFFEMWKDGLFGNAVSGGTVFAERAHAATAKAVMINTARSYSFSGTGHDLTRTHQGWGLPNVQRLYDMRNNILIIDETELLTALQTHSYTVQIVNGLPNHDELKATLAWTDLQGTTSALQHRINDLTLKVTSPTGTIYYGNNGLLAGNWSTSGGGPNTIDTVENVFIQNPISGLWTIEITAAQINQDGHVETPQMDADYALVVSGGNAFGDCNGTGIDDQCDLDCGFTGCNVPGCGLSLDCNANGVPDECELPDCNANEVPDSCELAGNDCNSDFVPDDCQLAANDCDANLIPDDCDEVTLAATINAPADQAPCNGGQAVFGAAAPGATGYQWFRNGSETLSDGGNIAGANSATLTVDPASVGDEGTYHCVVSFGCIDASNSSATLDLATDDLQVTLISPSPIQTCASAGATIAAFEVSVNDATAVTFQWSLNGNDLVDGGNISGANSPRVEINPATGADVGFYTCTISNACDVDTPTAVGELRIASSFAEQPAPTVCVEYGSNAVFTAEAGTNPAPDFYRWYEGLTQLTDGGRISGAWTDTMTLTNVQLADHGRTFQLRLIVGSPFCSNYSQTSQLMALPVGGCPDCPNPGDMDGDGDFDLADAQLFAQCFDADVLTRSECGCANVHPADTFVNLLDWEALEALLTGPN